MGIQWIGRDGAFFNQRAGFPLFNPTTFHNYSRLVHDKVALIFLNAQTTSPAHRFSQTEACPVMSCRCCRWSMRYVSVNGAFGEYWN
jgi:hypothetical protein